MMVLVHVGGSRLGDGIRESDGVQGRQHLGDNYMSQRPWPVSGEYDDSCLPSADGTIGNDFEDVEMSIGFGFDYCSK